MNSRMSRSDFLRNISMAGLGLGLTSGESSSFRVSNIKNDLMKNKSFGINAFLLDLRVEVMTMDALKSTAKQLSQLGINALIIEYTASFPYVKHATITGGNAYSRKEIKDFVAYCATLDIEVIPLQENMGHVQYILSHERYANLRIHKDIISQVDPLNEKAIPFFRELIEDMISLHPSRYIHLGGDETRHLFDKKYKEYIDQYGVSKLYTQYMKQICDIAIKKGKTPLLWADMILRYPEAIEELPIDKIIFINWIYTRANADMFGDVGALQKKGCNFWGAAALRSWPDNYFIERWKYHLENIQQFIPYSRKAGYQGMIMTSWSTSGVYDCRWEGPSKILLETFPRRNLYPLSGFNLLIAAYHSALEKEVEINIEQFVKDYAKKKYGLSPSESHNFWKYISHKQKLIETGASFSYKKIEQVLKDFRRVSDPLEIMEPTLCRREFEHYKLMSAIRDFYLSVLRVESMVESDDFDRSKIKQIGKELRPLKRRAKALNYRFIALNEGYLFHSELDRLNNLRNIRLERLWARYGF